MKNFLLNIRMIGLMLQLLVVHTALAQVNITIRVLPPYQSRITEYASRPDLMLLTVTNTSGTARQVQLTASISGDNGVGAWVKPGYRSPQPLELAPGQVVSLNGTDIAFLFDHNQIEYTGISQADFTRGVGLLEGTYQLCVRALDYTTHEPLSPEAPMGCTQLVISSVEPPTILMPFNEQEIKHTGAQALPITWSTPPGSSPMTRYKVKMVEMIVPRNPNDAMQSATTPPFFEETVSMNTILYGPAHPQLTPGRQYALMVQAIDPFRTISFRNQGMSEVIMFTYGSDSTGRVVTAGTDERDSGKLDESAIEYATNSISGKLSWAFKTSEEQYRKAPVTQVVASSGGSGNTGGHLQVNPTVTSTFMQVSHQSLANYYLSHNPLQAARPVALAQADPTLSKAVVASVVAGMGVGTIAPSTVSAADIISTSGTESLAFSYETVSVDTGVQRYPLANVTVTIRGVKTTTSIAKMPTPVSTPGKQPVSLQQDMQWAGLRTAVSLEKRLTQPLVNQLILQPATERGNATTALPNTERGTDHPVPSSGVDPASTLLATAKTDVDGNFTLQLLHPEYEGKNPYEHLIVSINAEGFEPFEYMLPVQRLSEQDIDLGVFTLLAKTYRFNPKISIEQVELIDIGNPGIRIQVYRDANELERYPYLQQEGNVDGGQRTPVTINGRKYVPVAIDSVAAGGNTLKSLEFTIARLFYQGSLYVEIEGMSGTLVKRTTNLRISDTKAAPSRILLVKPGYQSRLSSPAISGEVILHAGENMVPVSGVVLTVEYDKEDMVSTGVSGADLLTSLPKEVFAAQAVAAVSSLMGSQTSGTVSYATHSTINPVNSAAAAAVNGISRPVAVTSSSTQLNTSISAGFGYSQVLASDENMSEQQLRNKYGQHTVKTDSTGQYHIGNLPLLKEGANYTIKIVSVPYNYRDMEVIPGKEQIFAAMKGTTETRSFSITPEVFNLVGKVVDLQGKGVPYARLHFKGGSSYFETGEAGHFQTSYYAGKHTLVMEKEGYILKEITIELGAEVDSKGLLGQLKKASERLATQRKVGPGDDVMRMANPATWVESMQQTTTVQQAVQAGHTFSPAMFGNAGSTALSISGGFAAPQMPGGLRSGPYDELPEGDMAWQQISLSSVFSNQITTTFRANDFVYAQTKTHDLGDIGPLLPRIGKVRFTVVEQGSNQRIAGATVQLFDTTQVTDGQGQWLYEGFGGQTTVTITPPTGLGYVTLQSTIQIRETGEVTEVTLSLEKGIRVYGQVSSGTQHLGEARITVEGKDYLSVITEADGSYELVLPVGEQVIRAAKSGYFSKNENRILQQGPDVQLNFNLEDGGGKNISTLLGFEIELDKAVQDGNGEKWSGKFVNLIPVASLFKNTTTQTLPFANVNVTFDAEGNAIPQQNEVITDATNLSLKLFGYLPVTLKGNQQIKVVKNAQGKGSISGQIQLAVNQIQGSRGFTFLQNDPLFIALQSGSEPADIEVFREEGAMESPEVTVHLANQGGSIVSMQLYGFSLSLDLSASTISTNGLNLTGTIITPALGPISSAEIGIETFSISRELRIQRVSVKNSNLPSLKIGSWEAVLANVLFNENGFKIGGKLKVSIPQSGESNVEFSNLSLGKDALYGGQFSFPSEGINVYNIVRLTTGGNPLSFGRVGNMQVYSLAGSAGMKFDKLITKEIRIPLFQIQTDGRFLLQAPVNYSAELAFAKFNVKNLTASTLSGQAPFISVQGEFNVNFKGLKFEVADIRFNARAGGGSEFSVGTIGGELAVPVMKVAVRVGLKENGFEGGGALGIPGTPINAEVNFHYHKVSGGVDIGARFKSGIIIPIGIVEINKIGGGFSFNTGNGKFMINITGGASITGLSTLVNLEPISLTVTDGPVIVGEVGVKIVNAFEVVKARVQLNFPGKFFSIEIKSDIEPIKGVASARLNGLLRIKWDPDDTYVFLGANTEVNVLGFFKSYGEYAMGINIWDPKYRNDDIAGYFKYLDDDLYVIGQNYRFSGVYLHAKTEIGVPKERAVGIDLTIVRGKAWFHSYSDVMLLLNFGANDYRFRLGGGISAGAEGCVGPGCIGAGFSACYAFTGGYSDVQGWFLGGKAAGSFEGHVGTKCSCNELCVVGGRICIGAHAAVNISTRGNNHFSVGLGSSNSGNACSN